jgi:hypothetical protein
MATDDRIEAILAKRRGVSPPGRAALAAAVSIDHGWDLPMSSVDLLIAAVENLSDADLEAAHLLAGHLEEAINCVLIRRDTAKLTLSTVEEF